MMIATQPMQRYFRRTALVSGSLAAVLAIGFAIRLPWLMHFCPSLASGLSPVFISSIFAAVAAPVLLSGLSGEPGAAIGGALNLMVTACGATGFLLLSYRHSGDPHLLVAAILGAGSVMLAFGFACVAHRYPIRDPRPMPTPVRLSFVLFTLILIPVGYALLTQSEYVYPWQLNQHASTLFGWIYLGAACYFLYGVLRPSWHNARGQLFGFLAYDLVLLPPFLAYLPHVESERLPSLLVYIAVLIYSGALAVYYLLFDKATAMSRRPAGAAERAHLSRLQVAHTAPQR